MVLEELLAAQDVTFSSTRSDTSNADSTTLDRPYAVLIVDLIGLTLDDQGKPNHSELRDYIESKGGTFHESVCSDRQQLSSKSIHFFYQPHLSTEQELLAATDQGQYDAVIAAATFLPSASQFAFGGVRIGAGTGNMGSASWGGGNGEGGIAPLMNTPSFNSRATAHMAIKALLKIMPCLPVDLLHQKVVNNDFDTGKNLCEHPTEKLEGKRIAILGYGNIGREVAQLARAFGMQVAIYARPHHQQWIESEGFIYAATPLEAAQSADVISPHTGLGAMNADTGQYANAGLIDALVLNALNDNSVVINYDRGEVIDTEALDQALASNKVRYAAIDADIFIQNDGSTCGPMHPYLAVEQRHRGKMELLPHVAADTEHVSRVEGAKQAVDQIMNAILLKEITNLKGELPEGYSNAGAMTVKGVGKVSKKTITEAASNQETLKQLRSLSEDIAAFWGAVEATKDADRQDELIRLYGAQMVKVANTYRTLNDSLGLNGPYDQ